MRRYEERLVLLAYQYLHNMDDAWDVVQGMWADLCEKPWPLVYTERYLRRAVRNRCITFLRRRGRSQEVPLDHRIPSPGRDMDRALAISQCLARLDETDRIVLELRGNEGLTSREVGEKLGITEAAAAKRYERAKKKLKVLCEEAGVL